MIETSEMQNSVQKQNAQLGIDGMSPFPRLSPDAIDRNGDVA